MGIEKNIEDIQLRIARAADRSGRKASDITLLAVSKTVDIDTVRYAYDLGLRYFGENRPQELKRKQENLPEAHWHMIGRLQTNKIKDVVGRVELIHSLDRWNLAEGLDKRGQVLGVEVPALLEINIYGEEQKAGIDPDDVETFLESAGQLQALKIYGFMTMAPFFDDQELCRPVFRELAQMNKKFNKRQFKNVQCQYLSMGMSGDFEVAIEEGANIVRIGSSIFQS